ncbi:TadE family protein [Paramagnetospirillum kuznetsovii]|nr:TadE/TadG family type IV pilus assembly protein [Paramagnetospirillum kuznetsovii]
MIEFALVAIPAFMLMLGMIEIGLMTLDRSVVEGATREAARKIRTGSVQTSADPLGTFKQIFCANLFKIYDCATFSYDVRSFASFAAISLPAVQYDANGTPSNVVFQPGGAGTVTTVRVVHRHAFGTPLVGSMMGGGTGNSVPITATAVLKTEPYQ